MYNVKLSEIGDIPFKVTFFALNSQTEEIFSGRIFEPSVFEKPLKIAGEQNSLSVKEHFIAHPTIDLVQNLGLSLEEAQYDVYATYNSMKSNVMRVKIEIEE